MRCFIHIVTDTEFIRDPDGEDFADRRVAERETALVACDLMAEELRKGNRLPHRWKVLLALPDDTILMSLPFSQLIPAPPGFTSRSATIQLRDPNEGNRLTDADLHIMQGRARIEAQKTRIAKIQELGFDTSRSKDLLEIWVTTLKHLECLHSLLHTGTEQGHR
jgi:hypothetical protein